MKLENKWKSQRRISRKLGWFSTNRGARWLWSPQWLLVTWRDFICRHHTEPRVQEPFPNPTKYIGVVRTTHTNVDVLQETRINDKSDPWTGFTKFTGNMWSGARLAKIQATTRPDFSCPEIWFGMSKVVKKQEKQEWSLEKSKFDTARKLRCICFIEPEDEEFERPLETKEKTRNFFGSGYALQDEDKKAFLRRYRKM